MSQNNLPANGTADGSGSLAITFPPIANNTEFSGVLSIPTAPNTAQISVLVNGQQIATIGGSSQYGVIQINNNDVLQLTGTGFLPDTQYQAILSGFLAQGSVGQLIPTPTASQVEAALIGVIEAEGPAPSLIASGTATGGSLPTLTVPSNTRVLIITSPGNAAAIETANVVVKGVQTGQLYYDQPFYLQPAPNTGIAYVPVNGVVDTEYNISIGSGTVIYAVYADTSIYDESIYYNGVAQPANAVLAAAGSVDLVTNGSSPSGCAPFRLISLTLSTTATAFISLLQPIPTVGPAAVDILRAVDGEAEMTFTPNLIVPACTLATGTQLIGTQVGAGASAFSAVWAYP